MPGNGSVAKPGFVLVIPAKGESIMPPVSVCQYVSTIGHFFFPIFSLYQFQATSLIGSPTVPSTLNESNLYGLTKSKPIASSDRMAVGAALYKIYSLYVYQSHSKTFLHQDK